MVSKGQHHRKDTLNKQKQSIQMFLKNSLREKP